MGNGNQVTKDVIRGHSLFLPEEIRDQEGAAQVYVLEEEFARTKKNKNYKLYLFILLFIAGVLGGVLLFKLYRDVRDKIVDVDVTEFDDLRLKEIIDSARKRGSNIDVMQIELQMLEIDMLDKALKVRKESYQKEMDILAQGLSDDETDRRMAQLMSEQDARLKRVRSSYQAQVRRKKAAMWAMDEAREKEEKELASKGAETGISNSDRLYALRMKKLKDKQDSGVDALKQYYDNYLKYMVLTYNPQFNAPPLSDIINTKSESYLTRSGFLKEYDPLLGDSGFNAGDFSGLRKQIGDEALILKRLKRVPYKNSIPAALTALDGLSGSIVRDYEKLWSALAMALKSRNELLKKYEFAVDFVLSGKKENGLILDPRDPENILVRMNGSLKVEDGQIASVYNGKSYVGKIRLFRDSNGNYRAKAVSLACKSAAFQPTNRIMLDVKK